VVSFTPRERDTGTHFTGRWVARRGGLDLVSKRKIPSPRRESHPDHPIDLNDINNRSVLGVKVYVIGKYFHGFYPEVFVTNELRNEHKVSDFIAGLIIIDRFV
jgi:hypothetical protein